MKLGDRVYVAVRTSRWTAVCDTGIYLSEEGGKVAYIVFGAVRVADKCDVFVTEDDAVARVEQLKSEPVKVPS